MASAFLANGMHAENAPTSMSRPRLVITINERLFLP
jgi:hypothetical protein